VKLLGTGKTDLLHRFISKKGRPFSAFLVRQPDGKIGFEFAPREAKKGAKTAAKKAAPADDAIEAAVKLKVAKRPATKRTATTTAGKKTAAARKVAVKKAPARKRAAGS
jgi:DNA topoisomerase-3